MIADKSMLAPDTYKDKTILITGGGTGLGKSMAAHYLSLGANVVITSRKQDVLDATSKELDAAGKHILGVAGDVRKIEDVEKV